MSMERVRSWTFNVVVNEDLMPNETMAITGSCESLGQWKPGHCVLLDKGEDGECRLVFFGCLFSWFLVFNLVMMKQILRVKVVQFFNRAFEMKTSIYVEQLKLLPVMR